MIAVNACFKTAKALLPLVEARKNLCGLFKERFFATRDSLEQTALMRGQGLLTDAKVLTDDAQINRVCLI